jgi:ubiquinone/menaquinone biosynthesis C-methylase UbiE
MGIWKRAVLPRITDKVCGVGEIRPLRHEVTEGLHGDVVEIGFGSGLNLPHLPKEVDRILAVEPEADTGRKLAAERIRAAEAPVEFVGLNGEELPMDTESVDAALSTFSLCTIPDVAQALGEVRRVLRPGGELHFLEHGLHPEPKVARWQHRLTPVQRFVAGGCHFNRPIEQLVRDSGLEITSIRNEALRGPRCMGYLYIGTAKKV